MAHLPWFELKEGSDCPLCAPRPEINEYHYFICKLSVSSLYLARNQAYRGTCAIVFDPTHVTRLGELSLDMMRSYSADIWIAERAVALALSPDHINVETLGNAMPHLHTHIIPRYRSDPRWGGPIWMTTREEMPDLPASNQECAALATLLRHQVSRSIMN